jgi:hypothetical protein
MFRKTMQLLIIPALSIIAIISFGQNPAVSTKESKEWVTRSNNYTKLLIDIDENIL